MRTRDHDGYCPACGGHGCKLASDFRKCHRCGHEWGTVTDPVNHPPHYGGEDDPYEAIKVIEAWGLGFALGNAVKYVARAGKKGDAVEDLRKARFYLDREIQRREGGAA